jgi:hypothetical protein
VDQDCAQAINLATVLAALPFRIGMPGITRFDAVATNIVAT